MAAVELALRWRVRYFSSSDSWYRTRHGANAVTVGCDFSPADFAAADFAICRAEPVTVPGVALPPPRRKKRVVHLAGAGVVVVIGTGRITGERSRRSILEAEEEEIIIIAAAILLTQEGEL